MVSTRAHQTEFPPPDLSPSKDKDKDKSLTRTPKRPSTKANKWTHTPDPYTLLWLLVSLPLVIWDAIYVLLRPHTMPGGSLSWPIYTPYVLYGQIDYIYGEKAWKEHNGFTAAQTALNVFETAGYLGYLWVVWKHGRGGQRTLPGGWGGVACLTGFALSVMTVSKTVLYCEFLSIGQRSICLCFEEFEARGCFVAEADWGV